MDGVFLFTSYNFKIIFYTYILYSEKYERYYIGQCDEVEKRLTRHNNRMVPSTKSYVPWELVFVEEFETKAEANRRELYIKKMKSRKYIEGLIV